LRQAAAERPDGDAIVSNEAGLALSVSVADCVPILIADAKSGAAAAIHAGWRGTSAGVAAAAVEAMQREFGTEPSDCTAAIGPSIGPDDYEVGSELVESFLAAGHSRTDVDRWFRRAGDRLTLDLWTASRDQLTSAGIPPVRVFGCALSTLTHARVFESFRADGARAGRMAALIVVPRPASGPA
jgi:YfiH family protein